MKKSGQIELEIASPALALTAAWMPVSALTVSGDRSRGALADTLTRPTMRDQELIAEDMPDVNPEEAYMVGLTHAIGLLPSVLGWDGDEIETPIARFYGVHDGKRLVIAAVRA